MIGLTEEDCVLIKVKKRNIILQIKKNIIKGMPIHQLNLGLFNTFSYKWTNIGKTDVWLHTSTPALRGHLA